MEKDVLILGIGNLLWADEGFGVRCVEQLNTIYDFPHNVTLLDGGTQGLYLVQYVQRADIMVVFDAIDYGLESGTIKVIEGDDVPKFMGAKKMSLHQTGFQEVLMTAQFAGGYPSELILIGVQPEAIEDFGGSLRDCVKNQIQPALTIALDYLNERGVVISKKSDQDNAEVPDLAPNQLNIDVYEAGRPAEAEAYRHGDVRFIPNASNTQDGEA